MVIKIRNRFFSLIFLLVFCAAAYYFYFEHGIYTVLPGEVYRSAQLRPQDLTDAIQTYHIRSIANLRGEHDDKPWYVDEVKASQAQGVQHYDVNLRAYKLPPWSAIQQLIEIINTAPKPLLIHCEGGSDRTGLASAIVLILADQPLEEAKKQYSSLYLVFHKNSVGKLFFPIYEDWLQKQNLAHSKANFLAWVNENVAQERAAAKAKSTQ